MGGRVAIFMAHLVNMSPAASHNFALLRTDWHCCSQSKNKRTFFGRTSHLTTLHSFCSRSLPTQCARERQEGSAHITAACPALSYVWMPWCRRTQQRRAKSQVQAPRERRPRLGHRGRALRRWVPTQTWRQRVGIPPFQVPALRVSRREQAQKCSPGSLPCKPSSELR